MCECEKSLFDVKGIQVRPPIRDIATCVHAKRNPHGDDLAGRKRQATDGTTPARLQRVARQVAHATRQAYWQRDAVIAGRYDSDRDDSDSLRPRIADTLPEGKGATLRRRIDLPGGTAKRVNNAQSARRQARESTAPLATEDDRL